jgi:hypothetical protein
MFCAEEDGDIVSVTLLPSQYSRTIIVTRGLQTQVRVMENPPTGPLALIFLSQLSRGADRNAGNSSFTSLNNFPPTQASEAEESGVFTETPEACVGDTSTVTSPGSIVEAASLRVRSE